MKRQFAAVMFAGLIGVCATSAVAGAHDPKESTDRVAESTPVAVRRAGVPSRGRDEVSMVLLGTSLIGLAAALRRRAS